MSCRVFFLVLALCAVSVWADLSLDCGSSDVSYTDDNSMVWTGDDSFIGNGESQVVANPDSVSTVMRTLRVFKSRKKNCYNIPVDEGSKVFVRASFYYGNYDKKSSPPTFDLQFDGNLWTTVETSNDQIMSYEVIYVTKGSATSVCVAQTKPNQFPFMSALEVIQLQSDMYNHVNSNYALFMKTRVAYGTNETIRYKDDPYDRIWSPAPISNEWTTISSDDPLLIDNTGSANLPPREVLANAIRSTNTSTPIVLSTNLPTTPVPIYISMYFSEPAQLESTQTRSFELYIDNMANSHHITPPYEKVIELATYNMNATSDTSFSLVAASGSSLPPLINAMEVYTVGESPLTNGTNSKDESGLASLQNGFPVLQEWSGDPCLPAANPWDWVNCTTDATPRVIALFLKGYGLSGKLPDFSSLDAIQSIDMSNNNITGTIPDFLNSFTNLTYLNLSYNNFTGQIPPWLCQNNNLKFNISGNQYLSNSTSCRKELSPGSAIGNWFAGVLGGVLSGLIGAAILGVVRRWKQSSKEKRTSDTNAGQPNEEEESATPQTVMQSGTNNSKLEDKMSKTNTNNVVDRAVQTEIELESDVQPSTTTTT